MCLSEKTLHDNGIDKRNVHEVVLVGGSTLSPEVQASIQEFFIGEDIPDEATDTEPE